MQGTPGTVSIRVNIGKALVLAESLVGHPMPDLHGEALDLYKAVHAERDARYQDFGDRTHGGFSPDARGLSDVTKFIESGQPVPTFVHRPEHDVESIFWTMLVVFLRMKPVSAPIETHSSAHHSTVWRLVIEHQVPVSEPQSDPREAILEQSLEEWESLFPSEMAGVAALLHEISKHVASEYTLWTWQKGKYRQDHLHEAVQRLIFQYLVDHRDDAIPLDPDNLRPTDEAPDGPVGDDDVSATVVASTMRGEDEADLDIASPTASVCSISTTLGTKDRELRQEFVTEHPAY